MLCLERLHLPPGIALNGRPVMFETASIVAALHCLHDAASSKISQIMGSRCKSPKGCTDLQGLMMPSSHVCKQMHNDPVEIESKLISKLSMYSIAVLCRQMCAMETQDKDTLPWAGWWGQNPMTGEAFLHVNVPRGIQTSFKRCHLCRHCCQALTLFDVERPQPIG